MNTENQVKQIIANQFGIELNTVENNKYLVDYNLDSLDIAEIVMSLEQDFKIAIEDDEYKPVSTVGEIVDLVKSKLEKK